MFRTTPGLKLRDYPYTLNKYYVINRADKWRRFTDENLDKDEEGKKSILCARRPHSKHIIFLATCTCFFLATLLSLSKQNTSHNVLLNISVAELFFSLCGIAAMFYKQWTWLAEDYMSVLVECDYAQFLTGLRRIYFNPKHLVIAINIFFFLLDFGVFFLLMYFNTILYLQLKDTLYFRIISVFTLLVYDYVIYILLSNRDREIETSAIKLVLHEVKEELIETLMKKSYFKRINEIETFLDTKPLFQISEGDGIILVCTNGEEKLPDVSDV